MTGKAWEGSLKRNAYLAKHDRGQKVQFAIKSNPPKDSTRNGEYKRSIRQGGDKKYLRESCYHRIKYSAANPLVALMWK